MKREMMKKIIAGCIAVVLSIPVNMGGFVTNNTVHAATNTVENNEVKSTVEVSFKEEYPEVGKELHVQATGINLDECTYTWKVDQKVVGYNSTYRPTANDLEKFISVTVQTWENDNYEHSVYFSKLPVVYIDTNNVPIVDKENYVDGTMFIQGNEKFNSETTTLYDGELEIRGRGNSSWEAPKKPYRLKLGEKADIFGMGSNKHWTLLANYYDPSLSRNKLSFDFSGELGLTYMSSENVVLIMNDSYQGVYQLCEHIRVGKNRINITDWEGLAEDVAKDIGKAVSTVDSGDLEDYLLENMSWITTGKVTFDGSTYNLTDYGIELPDIDGGYLMEMDKNLDEVSSFWSSNNQPLMFKAPEYVKTNTEMMNYIKGYVNAFEAAIGKEDGYTTYKNADTHYSELYDIDSLAQYFLVTELFFNVDGMKKSTYLYKDNDDTMKMGPIWDMDWCAGGPIAQSTPVNKWQTLYYDDDIANKQWYRFLTKDPYFAYKVKSLYDTYRDSIESFVMDGGRIDACVQYLKEAAVKNDSKWNYGSGFQKDTTNLKNWLKERIAWLDAQTESIDTLLESWGKYDSSKIDEQALAISGIENTDDGIAITVHITGKNPVAIYVNGIKYKEDISNNGIANLKISYDELKDIKEKEVFVTARTQDYLAYMPASIEISGELPTPTPTPEVTPSPTPEITPSPTPEVTPIPTPEVTPSPTPEVTPSPTPEVTPIPTPEVTPSPTPTPTPVPNNPFDDIKESDYYYHSVLWALENNITAGWTENLFAPAMGCTRGQIVSFLWRSAGCPKIDTYKNSFKDVPESSYYYKAILWAVEKGITYGYNQEMFGPDDQCTRGQIVSFLWRANGSDMPESENHPFKDVKPGDYFYKPVLWAVENKITSGVSADSFAPDATCTRAEAVTFLYRAFKDSYR